MNEDLVTFSIHARSITIWTQMTETQYTYLVEAVKSNPTAKHIYKWLKAHGIPVRFQITTWNPLRYIVCWLFIRHLQNDKDI